MTDPTGSAGRTVNPANGLPPLAVFADLRIEVDGVPAHLTSAGDRLELRTERPFALLAGLPATIGPASARGGPTRLAGQAATLLAENGVGIDVVTSRGLVARLGAGADSRVGRLVTGSCAVQPGSASAVGRLLAGSVPAGAVRVGGGVLAAAGAWYLGRLLRRRA
ncbi:hypothetical protein JL107_17310 [Nakamurella flavida]|uniref:Uncharacterized protein n=1 Tax=Nakamurella flavida TaxID=363630 RepID=A0A938YSS6_9ACTN|nr:hypothetical protein [Nakamurella flavida]MBM9478210.1 hypothetical protein [Nakamurella flavida]MDP9778568.1 hypothetical protein [Nakamurella flavida]